LYRDTKFVETMLFARLGHARLELAGKLRHSDLNEMSRRILNVGIVTRLTWSP